MKSRIGAKPVPPVQLPGGAAARGGAGCQHPGARQAARNVR